MVSGLLEEFRADVERIFGQELVSLTLYGTHATEEPKSEGSEISVLIVVGTLRREALSAFRGIAHRYARRGIPAPPIFTECFLRESADVFPLEFLGMAERRRVLSGKDIIAELDITTGNLRHQVEFELKGKLVSLRRMYLKAYGNKEMLALLRDTAGSIVSVARGLLLLNDRETPHGKTEILDAIEKRFNVSLPAIREALAARRGEKIASGDVESVVFRYLEEVDRLCTLADGYYTEPGK
ncbi:MAG: hypothetical protein HY896_07520 [Deltaproteobacteria bacterium]|nr:hypothetical protein [Deltaproteobacteria bacterium]